MKGGIAAPHFRGQAGKLPEFSVTPSLLPPTSCIPLPKEGELERDVYQLGILSVVHGPRDPETQRAAAFFWDFDHRSHPELLARYYERIADWDTCWVRYLLGLDHAFRTRLIWRVEQRRRDPAWQPPPADGELLQYAGVHDCVLRPLLLKYYPDLGYCLTAKRNLVRDCIAFASGDLAIRHEPALNQIPATNGGPDSPAIFMFAEFALLLAEREERARAGSIWREVLAAFAAMQAAYKETFGDDAAVAWPELCRRHDEMDLRPLSPQRAREIEEQYATATDPNAIAREYAHIVHGMLSDQYFPAQPKS
ncbi:MAG: hypothetical protein ACF8MJ_11105 [Phycisphaerales bacterium JB050]